MFALRYTLSEHGYLCFYFYRSVPPIHMVLLFENPGGFFIPRRSTAASRSLTHRNSLRRVLNVLRTDTCKTFNSVLLCDDDVLHGHGFLSGSRMLAVTHACQAVLLLIRTLDRCHVRSAGHLGILPPRKAVRQL